MFFVSPTVATTMTFAMLLYFFPLFSSAPSRRWRTTLTRRSCHYLWYWKFRFCLFKIKKSFL